MTQKFTKNISYKNTLFPAATATLYVHSADCITTKEFTFAISHRPPVSRLSVTFVRPTKVIEIFGKCLYAIWYLGHM